MSSNVLIRSTLFKVSKAADVDSFIQRYATLKQDAKKDGQPYILEVTAGKSIDDPRNQGFTVFTMLKFSSIEDMQYYDNEDEAHKALKAAGKGKVELPPLVVYSTDFVHA